MGWREWLFGERDVAPVRPTLLGVPSTGWGTSVTPATAIGLSSVWRCLDILSNGVSQLPWREVRGNLELPPSRLVVSPLGLGTRREWVSYVVSVLALYDVAYLLKVGGTDSEGVPVGLLPIEPNQVMPVATTGQVSPFLRPPAYFIGQREVPADQLVILHRSPMPGVSDTLGGVLQLARVTFAAAMAAEGYASRYWQSGGNPVVALETDAHLNSTEANEISDRWTERRSRGPDYAPVLSGGVKAHPFGADPTAESAVEARREMVADIGRYFGMPTRLLNAPAGDSETYASTESGNQDLVRYTLQNYINAIEDAISDQLPGGRRMVMNPRQLTRGTQLAEAQAIQLLTGSKAVVDVDEVRIEYLGLPPVEDPDTLNPPAPAPVVVAPGGATK